MARVSHQFITRNLNEVRFIEWKSQYHHVISSAGHWDTLLSRPWSLRSKMSKKRMNSARFAVLNREIIVIRGRITSMLKSRAQVTGPERTRILSVTDQFKTDPPA